MKTMKGKLLKQLKTVKAIGYLKPDRILQVNALDGYLYTSHPKPPPSLAPHPHWSPLRRSRRSRSIPELEVVDVSELMNDLIEDEIEFDSESDDKENFRLEMKENKISIESKARDESEFRATPLSEIDVALFRRPDLNSGTLFDPKLLAVFEQALMQVKALEAERRSRTERTKNSTNLLRNREKSIQLRIH